MNTFYIITGLMIYFTNIFFIAPLIVYAEITTLNIYLALYLLATSVLATGLISRGIKNGKRKKN